ncbi:hypothetical protein AVEN_134630-1 [Araneus ventricosus]|uniref:Uncharacterized protein n=1 Tax=Araneus ventricosus TaxID=182803 RepID=A0A4Y2UTR4_ARAVE|nr:hypothetical protein AVEN_134630-1 [Araneus ventricosus]
MVLEANVLNEVKDHFLDEWEGDDPLSGSETQTSMSQFGERKVKSCYRMAERKPLDEQDQIRREGTPREKTLKNQRHQFGKIY